MRQTGRQADRLTKRDRATKREIVSIIYFVHVDIQIERLIVRVK